MLLQVDYRETKLIAELKKFLSDDDKNPKHIIEECNLHIGDACICSDDRRENIIIERKTIKDLESSIKDSRYQEQSLRLSHSDTPNHNILYIIEGDLLCHRAYNSGTASSTVFSAIISLMYFKGFSVFFSQNVNDTAYIINSFCKKLIKDNGKRQPYYKPTTVPNESDTVVAPIDTSNDYLKCIKKQKRDNITRDNIWSIMLMQIPFVSQAIATAILEVHTSVPELISNMVENEKCLLDIFTTDINGKKRKIPSNAINNLKTLLLPNNTYLPEPEPQSTS